MLETKIPRDGLSFKQFITLKLSFLRCASGNLVKFLGKSLNQFFEGNYKFCNEGLTEIRRYAGLTKKGGALLMIRNRFDNSDRHKIH